ncbi:MAG: 2-oxo acid dehydrogenase subunit E2 [bacterium]|nr:2-oxo acid dehydrogenase subunit E2 [bacterium]
MAKVDMVMPQLGESIAEGTIVSWKAKIGDTVTRDVTILEVATDKATLEVPSPATGTLVEILVEKDITVPIKTVIARIETEAGAVAPASAAKEEKVERPKDFPEPVMTEQVDARSSSPHDGSDRGGLQPKEFSRGGKPATPAPAPVAPAPVASLPPVIEGKRFYSPVVMKMASEHNVSMDELSRIPGTGLEGRVSKKDMEQYLAHRGSTSSTSDIPVRPAVVAAPTAPAYTTPPPPPATASAVPTGDVSGYIMVPRYPQYQASWKEGDRVEVQPMEYIRKKIAEHMVYSKHFAPHVYSNIEIDMTRIMKWREANKDRIKEREGVNITPTVFVAHAVCSALKEHPWVNASVRGTDVIVRKDYHIGIAVATEKDLIVPVVKHCDQLSVIGIAKQISLLAAKARSKTITPDELQGGTFTITNAGVFGNIWGAPIINQPQVAILSTGAVVKRAWVTTDANGDDSISVRSIMQLTLSYDHRVVDGMLAGKFLSFVKKTLESLNPEAMGL